MHKSLLSFKNHSMPFQYVLLLCFIIIVIINFIIVIIIIIIIVIIVIIIIIIVINCYCTSSRVLVVFPFMVIFMVNV
jgi:hypothetical protein